MPSRPIVTTSTICAPSTSATTGTTPLRGKYTASTGRPVRAGAVTTARHPSHLGPLLAGGGEAWSIEQDLSLADELTAAYARTSGLLLSQAMLAALVRGFLGMADLRVEAAPWLVHGVGMVACAGASLRSTRWAAGAEPAEGAEQRTGLASGDAR